MDIKTKVRQIFSGYISSRIPKSQTNVFWMLFNGIDTAFTHIETLIRINKRERNILTAQNIASLRSLAASNGFEPVLKVPSSGIVSLKIHPILFSRVGYPLYLAPYSVLKNNATGINYYFDSNTVLKIDNNAVLIPVIEGELFSTKFTSTGNIIERIYIDSDNISNDSIKLSVGTEEFVKVNSFSDNENINNNKQFIVKFSNKPNSPIVLYVRGTKLNEVINIVYRLTFGESGNIDYNATFSTESLINNAGVNIELADDEIEIKNISGFTLGSNGTDANSLRAAIGFNHGTQLLFDSTSYSEFLNKFSTLLVQDIILSSENKSINNIYLSRRQYVNEENSILIGQYIDIIGFRKYLLSTNEITELNKILNKNEFALVSHNLYNSIENKFAIQLLFDNVDEMNIHQDKITHLIYLGFAKFLYDKYHQLNLELLFNDYMEKNKISFEYTVFNQEIESKKLTEKNKYITEYIIKHKNTLPILKGDFNICNIDYQPITLFSDINIVSK